MADLVTVFNPKAGAQTNPIAQTISGRDIFASRYTLEGAGQDASTHRPVGHKELVSHDMAPATGGPVHDLKAGFAPP